MYLLAKVRSLKYWQAKEWAARFYAAWVARGELEVPSAAAGIEKILRTVYATMCQQLDSGEYCLYNGVPFKKANK